MGMTVAKAISTYRQYRKRLRRIQGHSAHSVLARQRNQDGAEALLRDLVGGGYLTLVEDLVAEAGLVRRLSCQDLPVEWRPKLEDDLGYVRSRIAQDAKKHGDRFIST